MHSKYADAFLKCIVRFFNSKFFNNIIVYILYQNETNNYFYEKAKEY